MDDYKAMYYKLFNQITDTIEVLNAELEKLKTIQQYTEEYFINNEETSKIFCINK